jgi:RNA polymerase sigma factor (sigma-70 family)
LKASSQHFEAAVRQKVPFAAVYSKCRNWGIGHSAAFDLAEEVAAESFKKAVEADFESEGHFRAWVTRTACNYLVDQLRLRKLALRATSDRIRPVSASDSGRRELILSKAMAELRDEDRFLLEKYYLEGLPLDDVAALIFKSEPLSENAKRLRVVRMRDAAVERLRIIIQPMLDSDDFFGLEYLP